MTKASEVNKGNTKNGLLGSVNNPMLPTGIPTGGEMAQNLLEGAFGNLLSIRPMARYMTGARAIIKINNELYGFAFDVSFNISTQQDEINTVDDFTPYEFAPKRITIDGTLSQFHLPGKGPSAQLVQSNVLSFLFHRYITLEIRDRQSDALIFLTRKAVITSRSESLKAGEMAVVTLHWKAIGFQDEMQPGLPQGASASDPNQDTTPPILGAIGSFLGKVADKINEPSPD